jgi:hypothetical protein
VHREHREPQRGFLGVACNHRQQVVPLDEFLGKMAGTQRGHAVPVIGAGAQQVDSRQASEPAELAGQAAGARHTVFAHLRDHRLGTVDRVGSQRDEHPDEAGGDAAANQQPPITPEQPPQFDQIEALFFGLRRGCVHVQNELTAAAAIARL